LTHLREETRLNFAERPQGNSLHSKTSTGKERNYTPAKCFEKKRFFGSRTGKLLISSTQRERLCEIKGGGRRGFSPNHGEKSRKKVHIAFQTLITERRGTERLIRIPGGRRKKKKMGISFFPRRVREITPSEKNRGERKGLCRGGGEGPIRLPSLGNHEKGRDCAHPQERSPPA